MAVLGPLDSSHHHPARYPEIIRKADPPLPQYSSECWFSCRIFFTSLSARRRNIGGEWTAPIEICTAVCLSVGVGKYLQVIM